MAKPNVSLWATIVAVLLIFIFGIIISALFINLALHGEIAILNLIAGLFFLVVLPVLIGVFILVDRIHGKDYNVNFIDDNFKLPWYIKLIRLIFSLLMALVFLAIFMFLRAIKFEPIWLGIVITILQDILALAILAHIFLSLGKLKYFQAHKNKTLMGILFIVVILGLLVLINFLIKK